MLLLWLVGQTPNPKCIYEASHGLTKGKHKLDDKGSLVTGPESSGEN